MKKIDIKFESIGKANTQYTDSNEIGENNEKESKYYNTSI